MMSNNVVFFPRDKIVREDVVEAEPVKRAKKLSAKNYADDIVSEMVDAIMEIADSNGIENVDPFTRDMTFALEAVTAAVYRHFEIEHSFHKYMNESIKILEAENQLELETKVDDTE